MRKIPTLFQRDPEDRKHVLREVNPLCEWVQAGEGTATAKLDGVSTMLDESGTWWARREVRPGKETPPGFIELEADPVTGKRFGWEPLEQSAFAKLHRRALETEPVDEPDTYELVGPKIAGNPHGYTENRLIRHGAIKLGDVPTGFDELRAFLALWGEHSGDEPTFEGIVWHNPDGRMAKLKVRDFAPGVREWKPNRWYRVLNADGSLWCETSDPKEAAEAGAAIGQPVERLWEEVPAQEWRPAV